jgi:hypothetical protein
MSVDVRAKSKGSLPRKHARSEWEAMKTIIRRLRQLEEKAANQEIGGPNPVDVLRERRRRRAEASGVPYEEPMRDPKLYENGRRPTWAEVLRSHRARRCAEAQSRRAEEAAQAQ